MSNSLEQLRLAAALAHNVPGTEFTLHRRNAPPLIIGYASHADITPCQLRHIVGPHRCPMQHGTVTRVSAVEVGGSIAAYGGDLYTPRARAPTSDGS